MYTFEWIIIGLILAKVAIKLNFRFWRKRIDTALHIPLRLFSKMAATSLFAYIWDTWSRSSRVSHISNNLIAVHIERARWTNPPYWIDAIFYRMKSANLIYWTNRAPSTALIPIWFLRIISFHLNLILCAFHYSGISVALFGRWEN